MRTRSWSGRQVLLLVFGVLASAGVASAAEWAYYTDAESDGVKQTLFYQSDGIVHKSSGYIQVWVKALRTSDIEKTMRTVNKERHDRVAKRFLAGYQPPAARFWSAGEDVRLYTIGLEDVAATERLEPTLRALNEINCADSVYRVLSLYYSLNKKPITNESTGEWQHAAPETNADGLVQLMCQAKTLPAAPASPAAKPGG